MCRSCLSCSLLWGDISFDLDVLLERHYALGHAKKDLIFDRAEQAAPEGKVSQEAASWVEAVALPTRGKTLQHMSRAGLVMVTRFSQESRSSDKAMVMRR